ncbi:MAG: phosphate transport system permease protein [Frankiaceae bacterium]|jgi:phosphate transport system permease protein|nr:phosphate transport system permease protein [Frankiaceae bacterium]MDT7551045.1 phosphate transport system permease protein [Actinomycetota bacterium]
MSTDVVALASASRGGVRRRFVNRFATVLMGLAVAAALLPLASVLYFTVVKGLIRFGAPFLQHSMRGVGPLDSTGGAYHAIIGTLEQVGIATVIAVPLGLLAAVYTVEYGRGRLASLIRFFTDVMTGVPSIVAGLFIYAFWVLALNQGFSGFAAALALTILMLPTIVRSAEEMLKLVPDALREAALALGIPRWRTILSVVLPTAMAGIVTGVMLAIARVAGETAPLLLTALNFDAINVNPFKGQQAALPTFIFSQAGAPQKVALDRAWAGALTLVGLIVVLNLIARAIARRSRVHG